MRALVMLSTLWISACTGTIVGGGTGGTGDDDDDVVAPLPDAAVPEPDAEPVILPLATGIDVRDIDVYQGVRVPIVDDGTEVANRNAPVVAGAAAMIRVGVSLDGEWQNREVTGELAIEVAPGDIRLYAVTRTVSAESSTDPDSGFAFKIDGADITTTSRYAVTIRELTVDGSYPGTADGARYPAVEIASFGALSSNGPLNLVLVPFQYNADGSGRLPPTDATSIQYYKDLFTAMYPVAEVNLTVREPVPYSSSISSGGGWGTWLDRLAELRDNDDPPPNTYYYGIASPRSSFSAYCNGGCIIGMGWVPGRNDEYGRASVGVAFDDRLGGFTAAHEVGHTLGRNHTPCGGPSGVDWSYPYSGGRIGVWGYDAIEDSLKNPDDYTDVMGYCNTQWISDYTYEAIFERISYVNSSSAAAEINSPQTYRVGLVDDKGVLTWRRYDDVQSRVGGDQIDVALLDGNGAETGHVTGHYYRYDHLGGGMLLVPVPRDAPAAVRPAGIGTVAW